MKQKNFPTRKLKRQLIALGIDINSLEAQKQLIEARTIRTKKSRV